MAMLEVTLEATQKKSGKPSELYSPAVGIGVYACNITGAMPVLLFRQLEGSDALLHLLTHSVPANNPAYAPHHIPLL